MSDQDAPDPADQAYTRAEAMLDDEAARAARRAQVLAAVEQSARAPQAAAAAPVRRPRTWKRGGWLAAASVAGLSTLVAVRLYQPAPSEQQPLPAKPPAVAPALPSNPAAPARVEPVTSAPPAPPAAPGVAAPAKARPANEAAVMTSPAPPAPAPAAEAAPAPPPPPPPAPLAAKPDTSDSVAAGSPVTAARSMARAASPAPEQVPLGVRLRAAAADGKVAEVRDLLDQRALVDAVDERGETALMKAVQANRPAAAALLRRRGADLDLKNRDGVSARDMAAALGDPALDQALGLRP